MLVFFWLVDGLCRVGLQSIYSRFDRLHSNLVYDVILGTFMVSSGFA